ncbi:MAG: hypothetical protein Q9220_004896 [cf. Caloplaca sp. 1 TL-2023]
MPREASPEVEYTLYKCGKCGEHGPLGPGIPANPPPESLPHDCRKCMKSKAFFTEHQYRYEYKPRVDSKKASLDRANQKWHKNRNETNLAKKLRKEKELEELQEKLEITNTVDQPPTTALEAPVPVEPEPDSETAMPSRKFTCHHDGVLPPRLPLNPPPKFPLPHKCRACMETDYEKAIKDTKKQYKPPIKDLTEQIAKAQALVDGNKYVLEPMNKAQDRRAKLQEAYLHALEHYREVFSKVWE